MPIARAALLVERVDGSWLANVRAPPVDGKANAELVALVAGHFGCPKSSVSILSGTSGRLKRVKIEAIG
jgi:uncharacterized protein YggU (UPF0235/DUF167 family)